MSDLLKILMLEDSADDADMIVNQLERAGLPFESLLVMNREDFFAALTEFKPNLILSDNSLPQFSATEALAIIQQQSTRVPFILVTGTVPEEFAANIIKLGADDFILKDRLARLPAAIDAALKKKQAEGEIRVKEEEIRFKAELLAAVGQAVIATDLHGGIIYWNKAAESIYGWSKAAAIGKNIIDITPSHQTREEARRIMELLQKGESWSGEFMMQRKDGTLFTAFVVDSPIYDKDGLLTGIIGVSSDITEGKNAERELKAMEEKISSQKIAEQKKISRAIIKAQEQERNHIGQELHDNVSQILAGTKLFLEMAARKNDMIAESIKYPLQLIESSIEEIRSLSSKNVTPLKNIDLEKLLQVLVENLDKTTSITTSFVYDVITPLADDELKLNIYRIVQEQVNNIIKHSKANNVTINVTDTGNCISIVINDDGKGFDMKDKRNGIGISNMMNRVESFNGKMEIISFKGNGCRTKVSLPFKF